MKRTIKRLHRFLLWCYEHFNNFTTLLVSYITSYSVWQYANILGCRKINWLLENPRFILSDLVLCASSSKTVMLMNF